MPFTAAHPAIILPLNKAFKRYVSLTALVIGSITPDFEYFLRMQIKSVYSHTTAGLLFFDLPVGLAMFILYNAYIKDVLISNLPMFLKCRLWSFKNDHRNEMSSKQWLIVVTSLIIGAASHSFWDAFTHPTGWFVKHSDVLMNEALSVPYFKLLQHASTLVGISVIFYGLLKLPQTSIYSESNYLKFWIVYTLIFIMIFLTRIIYLIINQQPLAIGLIIVTLISAALLALLIQCLLVRYFKKRMA